MTINPHMERLKKEFRIQKRRKNSIKSMIWFKNHASRIFNSNGKITETSQLVTDDSEIISKINGVSAGDLIMFRYNAKTKKALKYWDKLPMVFFIRNIKHTNPPGFMGINFHYLHPITRIMLLENHRNWLENLDDSKPGNKHTKDTRWNVPISGLRVKPIKTATKRYIWPLVGGGIIKITPNEWENVIWLNSEKFVDSRNNQERRVTKTRVWRDTSMG